jgi:thymidylate synthase
MATYTFSNGNEAYLGIAKVLINEPQYKSSPRGYETSELINTTIVITNPYDRLVHNKYRKFSFKYFVGEFLWYERGSNLLHEIAHYSSFWSKISDDGVTCNSSYGKRIYSSEKEGNNQWEYVKSILQEDKSTRRAVMFISDKNDSIINTKDLPCTLSLQFLIRDNQLHLIVNMRSNDLFLGFCYDVAIFTLWQEKMLNELKGVYPYIRMGYYYHNVGSLHIYEQNIETIKKCVQFPQESNINPLFNMPQIDNLAELEYVFEIEESIRTKNKTSIRYQTVNDRFCQWLIQILKN